MKHKLPAPFRLTPYSKFDGWMLLLIFSAFFLGSLYLKDVASACLSGVMLFVFLGAFKLKYKSVMLEEDHLVVVNWLSKNDTHRLSEIKGYLLKESWGASGQLTTSIVIVKEDLKRIVIDRKYFYTDKLDRLLAAFERYRIPHLPDEEMKFKHKYLFEKISLYVFGICGVGNAILIFFRHYR